MPTRRIHIFQRHAVEGTPRTIAQTLQGLVSVFPFVTQVIAWTLQRFFPNRTGYSNSWRHTIGIIFHWLEAAGKGFPSDHLKQEQQRIIETIEPDDRLAAVAVSMPRHRRSKNQVSFLHRNFFAFDNRVGSGAFKYETERREVMPVILGHFPGLQQLHGHKHGVGRGALSSVLLSLIRRIDKPQHTPFRFTIETVHITHSLN